MELQFIGAARTVTGSLHKLETKKAKIIIDCGLCEGHRREAFACNQEQARIGAKADVLLLSHAHIDHSGNIPTLVKNGFTGNIWATAATRDLCAAMLRDSAHLQEQDVAYLNKHRSRRGDYPVEPLYTRADADDSMQYFVSIAYGRPFPVADGVSVTFYDAGHILGSALLSIEVEEAGRKVHLGYACDLGRKNLPILRDPQFLTGLDYLILESTYGGRRTETPDEAQKKLQQVINNTYKRGGKVIIPSFAVGRTQEIIYDLYRLSQAQKIPELPVFVDSPLAVDATEIFRLHPECYDEEMRRILEDSRFGPLGSDLIRYVRSVEESKKLNFLREPAVIISASGMCEGGRILHHLANNIEDDRNTLLFVGYQAENTLGRRIQDGVQSVRIFDEEYTIRAHVESINGYSAHANADDLVRYAETVAAKSDLKGIFLVHGENEGIMALAEALRAKGLPNVRAPQPREKAVL